MSRFCRLGAYLFGMFLIWGSALLSFCVDAYAQPTASLIEQQKTELESRLASGDRFALHTAGAFLDEPSYRLAYIQLLKSYTHFTPAEVDWSSVSRKSFQAFIHSHEVRFSPILSWFYVTPIENRPVDFQRWTGTSPKKTKVPLSVIEYQIDLLKNDGHLSPLLPWLMALEGRSSPAICQQLHDKALTISAQAWEPTTTEAYLNALENCGSSQAVATILSLIRQKKAVAQSAEPYLARMTNQSYWHEQTKTPLLAFYEAMVTDEPTFAEARMIGYQKIQAIEPTFFQDPVDYYALVMVRSRKYPWTFFNAHRDVLATQHPRALFYVAAAAYLERKNPKICNQLVESIQQATFGAVALMDSKQVPQAAAPQDSVWLYHHMLYWSSHYETYQWDADKELFMDKEDLKVDAQNLDRLFRLLQSTNDSVAFTAYKQLSRMDKRAVNNAMEDFKLILRRINPSIPSLQSGYLEVVSEVGQLTERYQLPTQLSPALLEEFLKVKGELSFEERQALEQQIIENFGVEKITAIELYLLDHPYDMNLSLSGSRIVDGLYSKWLAQTPSEKQCAFLIEKMMWLMQIKEGGSCRNLATKILPLLSSETIERLKKSTQNEWLLLGLMSLEWQKEAVLPWSSLFYLLKSQRYSMPYQLPVEQKEDIIPWIESDLDAAAKANIWDKMDRKWAPALIALLDESLSIEDRPIQEPILQWLSAQFSFQNMEVSFWKSLEKVKVQNMSGVLAKWMVDSLHNQSSPNVQYLIAYCQNVGQKDFEAHVVLEGLGKVDRLWMLSRIQVPKLFKVEQHLSSLEFLDFPYRDIDDVGDWFDLKMPADRLVFWDFIWTKMSAMEPADRGQALTEVFRKPWALQLLASSSFLNKYSLLIQEALSAYSESVDFLSEYEENSISTLQFLMSQPESSIAAVLTDASKKSLPPQVAKRVAELVLSRTELADLPTLLPLFKKQPEWLEYYPQFWADLGLNPHMMAQESLWNAYFQLLQSKQDAVFYKAQLQVHLPKGERDKEPTWARLYQLLEYGLTYPFTGNGGKFMDYSAYTSVKYLEALTGQSLGFHHKLNENQTIITFTPESRIRAWQQWLMDENKVKMTDVGLPSMQRWVP